MIFYNDKLERLSTHSSIFSSLNSQTYHTTVIFCSVIGFLRYRIETMKHSETYFKVNLDLPSSSMNKNNVKKKHKIQVQMWEYELEVKSFIHTLTCLTYLPKKMIDTFSFSRSQYYKWNLSAGSPCYLKELRSWKIKIREF